MYEYFKGYVIREGNEGIRGEQLRELYQDAGWISENLPIWQNEKFEYALKNSAWAFTVWHKEELVGMVRVISDKVMFASIQDLIVKQKHRKKGIGTKLIQLCLQRLPHGSWATQTTPENYRFYQNCEFEIHDHSNNTTLIYNGFSKAIKDGHR